MFLINLLLFIFFIVAFGPILISWASTCITAAITTCLIVISAPFMWVILYFCERQQKRIQLQLDKAIEEGADKGRIYFLNMQYKEAEEREERLTKFTCSTLVLTLFTIVGVWIVMSI